MKEQKRLKARAAVDAVSINGRKATEKLRLSMRQTRRPIAACRKEGATGKPARCSSTM